MPTADVIVLGTGGFGSSAFCHLARRGQRVIGLEQFAAVHDRGSSHGETRIIRKAYFEHPDYVPLLLRAYDEWANLESACGKSLFHRVGLMIAGLPEGEAVAGARRARAEHHVPLEEVSAGDAALRFPGFQIPDGFDIVFEPDGGYLDVEDCVRAYLDAGIAAGGVLRTNERVRSWSSDGRTVQVLTDRDTYSARALVVTGGPWAGSLLAGLQLPLRVVRKVLFWCPVRGSEYAVENGCPTFYIELPGGAFYGFPSLDGRTLKVAEHTGGEPVADPGQVERDLHPHDFSRIAEFLRDVMPAVDPLPIRHSVCMYTLTPDHHFVVDQHPEWPNVAFGAGFSGHGFKFTSILGSALADLATDGRTDCPIAFLTRNRLLST